MNNNLKIFPEPLKIINDNKYVLCSLSRVTYLPLIKEEYFYYKYK